VLDRRCTPGGVFIFVHSKSPTEAAGRVGGCWVAREVIYIMLRRLPISALRLLVDIIITENMGRAAVAAAECVFVVLVAAAEIKMNSRMDFAMVREGQRKPVVLPPIRNSGPD